MEFFAFDAEYLMKLRAGDHETQRHFVEYFSDLIRLKLRSRLSSPEAMEDVRQETFARVFRTLQKEEGLRQADRLGSYVNTVCNHVLQEQYRSQTQSGTSLDETHEEVFVDWRPNPLSRLEQEDQARQVRLSLNKLSDRDRKLLQAVLMEDQDKDRLCAHMGISREYLRVLVHRAKQSFRQSYGAPG